MIVGTLGTVSKDAEKWLEEVKNRQTMQTIVEIG